ncbi:hypothetical protein [Colwellia piezophila]|uniref:hypothetical protein n=1 Tax=Colwellia piezophila TaxID=211668 RepID=UPI00036592B9|nr:hypothetical protein [Colwellia piezophila]
MRTKQYYDDFEKKVSEIIDDKKAEDLEVADAFFLQQILVRRFKLKNRGEFDELVNIRKEIENLAEPKFLPYHPHLASKLDLPYVVDAVMSLLLKESQKSFFEALTTEQVEKELVEEILSKQDEPFGLTIDKEFVVLIKRFLESNQERFRLIVNAFNYFDFYSPLEMSIEVDFQKLLAIYHTAFYEIEKYLSLSCSVKFTINETNWCHGYDCNYPELEYFYKLGFPHYQSNVDIIINEGTNNDYDNDVVINNYRTSNSLYIRLPLNEAPKMLDRKIERAKNTLKYYYKQFNVNDDAIKQSNFFKFKSQQACCVLKESRSMLKVISSLATWDIAKRTPESTVDGAIKELLSDIDNINQLLKDYGVEKQVIPYANVSYRRNYDDVTSLIKGNTREVDTFLTGSDLDVIGKNK